MPKQCSWHETVAEAETAYVADKAVVEATTMMIAIAV